MATEARRKRSSIFYETAFRAANFSNKFYYTAGVTIVPRNSNENFRSVRTAAPTLSRLKQERFARSEKVRNRKKERDRKRMRRAIVRGIWFRVAVMVEREKTETSARIPDTDGLLFPLGIRHRIR